MNSRPCRTRILIVTYFMAITFAIIIAYPGLFNDLRNADALKSPERMRVLPPTFLSPENRDSKIFSATKTTSIFRQNPERTGFDSVNSISPELRLAWTFRPLNAGIHTASKASPAIDSTGIYIGTDDSWFYALDFEGHVRWKFFVSGAARGIHGTASLDETRVYFGAYNGSLYCLDKGNGHLIWTVQLGIALGASPVLYGDHVYAGVELNNPLDGYMVKVQRADGKVIWTSPFMGEQSHSSPTIDHEHELAFEGANNGHVFAYSLPSGDIKWSLDLSGAVKSTSALVNGSLFISSWSKQLTAVEPSTGHIIWHSDLAAPARSSPSFVPGLNALIIEDEDGHVFAFDARNGNQIWTFDTQIKPLISSALVIKDFHQHYLAWLPCAAHVFCALEPSTGKIVANYPIETALTSVPVAFGHDLYVALDKDGGLLKFSSRH